MSEPFPKMNLFDYNLEADVIEWVVRDESGADAVDLNKATKARSEVQNRLDMMTVNTSRYMWLVCKNKKY